MSKLYGTNIQNHSDLIQKIIEESNNPDGKNVIELSN